MFDNSFMNLAFLPFLWTELRITFCGSIQLFCLRLQTFPDTLDFFETFEPHRNLAAEHEAAMKYEEVLVNLLNLLASKLHHMPEVEMWGKHPAFEQLGVLNGLARCRPFSGCGS